MSIADRTRLDLENIALRVIALMAQTAGESRRAPLLAVTSARPREGKTYLTSALALYAAGLGHRVLAVDANADDPALHLNLKCEPRRGFFDALARGPAEAWQPQPGPVPRLSVLPAGERSRRALMFAPGALDDFARQMAPRYDLVVFDAPDLTRGGAFLASHCDKSVLVVDASRTRREVIQGALASSGLDRARLLGVVLNKRPLYIPRLFYRFL